MKRRLVRDNYDVCDMPCEGKKGEGGGGCIMIVEREIEGKGGGGYCIIVERERGGGRGHSTMRVYADTSSTISVHVAVLRARGYAGPRGACLCGAC